MSKLLNMLILRLLPQKKTFGPEMVKIYTRKNLYTGFRVKGEKELQSDIFYMYTGFRVKSPIKLEY